MSLKRNNELSVAVVGATGIVGQEFLELLVERKFPVKEVRAFASGKSAGETVEFGRKSIELQELKKGCFKGCDVAFFSAGASVSLEWAPVATSEGAFVIDNSSAFRMHKEYALVVPEVNPHQIRSQTKPTIIANPNCSTIQLVLALKPLHDSFGLKSVIVSSYQSVSGAGRDGIEELRQQTIAILNGQASSESRTFPHPIAFNNIPQIDVFDDSGFTFEEKKIMLETRKIMELPNLAISATAVRTPTFNGHSEAVWAEIDKKVSRDEIVGCLEKAPGVVVVDDPSLKEYPLNREATGKDEVFVGRIRRDLDNERRWVMWVVSDNVRKGAALNGIQIAELLFGNIHI